jgi:hypothetical protein
MRIIKLLSLFIAVLLAGLMRPLSGQILEWPSLFAIPHENPAADSNGVRLGTEQSFYLKSLKSDDTVTILENSPRYGLSQTADYELTEDYWSNARNHFLDLSGEAVKKSLPLGISAAGLEWRPVLLYQRQSAGLGVLGAMEAGPIIRMQPYGVPVLVHGGVTGRAWEDDITGSLDVNQYKSMFHDKGVYGGVELGDQYAPLMKMPLYMNFKGYGRSMGMSNLVAATGYALLYHAMPNGDSIFALYADSLVNGNAVLGQTGGKPRLIDDPAKVERAFQLSAGFKGTPRLFLEPAVVFSYNQHSLDYLNRVNQSSDRLSRDYVLHFLLSTVPDFPVTYAGGFRVDWQNQQRLNGNPPSSEGVAPDLGSVQIDLDDYKAYHVSLFQKASKYLSNGMGIEYSFDISRFSREYPVSYYLRGGDTIGTNNDNDLIVSKQKLTVVPMPASWGSATLYYDFSKNLSYFIKQDKSSRNEIDWLYSIGATYKNTVFGRCTLSEATSADANVTRYAFPVMNRGSPPPYSRKWTSLTIANTPLTRRVGVSAELQETYSDDGTLNSREYLDTNLLGNQEFMATYRDYYSVYTKIWIHNIKFAVSLHAMENLLMQAGCAYQLNDAKNFDGLSFSYVPTPQAGRRTSPFAILEFKMSKHLAGRAAVTYNFDTYLNFWNIRIFLNGEF